MKERPVSESASALWDAFLGSGTNEAAEAEGSAYSAWQFGYGAEQGDRLLACVLYGPKRATAGALWAYETQGEAVPVPGDYSVLLDGHGVARCVIKTTRVDVVPFDQVDAAFAYDEGEGDRSLEYWRDVHWEYFTRELTELGREATPNMPVVCERFEVVYRADGATPAPRLISDYTAEEVSAARAPLVSLLSKSEKAQQKVVPGTWQHAMLGANIEALRTALALIDDPADCSDHVTHEELEHAASDLDSMIERVRNTEAKFAPGTSHHSLQRNRLKALMVARAAVSAKQVRRG
ncbi:MAG: ASCH domain-containing protein [Actinobacteria bacterium]|nr:MAG: ASCH domain-containing protein [Actinomycetota bacterium]